MNFFSKDKLESLAKIFALFLIIAYGAGFVIWNTHLSLYGYFEYDLLQTRFLSTGIISLLFFFISFLIFIDLLKKIKIKLRQIYIAFFIFFIFSIFSYLIFPSIPQEFGGARPFSKSIIAEPIEIEYLKNFNVESEKNAGGKDSVQSVPICEIYTNNDVIIIGVKDSGGYKRVLILKKDNFKGFQAIPSFIEREVRKYTCDEFLINKVTWKSLLDKLNAFKKILSS